MTREEAVARIKDHMFVHKIYEERAVKITEALNMAISALEQPETCAYWDRESNICALHRPSAQTEQRWIPVSERLPEPGDEYVLISKKPTKLSGSKWCVIIALRTADPRSGEIHWRDSGFGIIQDDEVLAWMPRPKPYAERRQDDT